ncbi:MAG: tail fiber domain-containing protein, partial [Gemmatimonadales bacterium]
RGRYAVTAFSPSLEAHLSGVVTLFPQLDCALPGNIVGTVKVTPLHGTPFDITAIDVVYKVVNGTMFVIMPGFLELHGQIGPLVNDLAHSFMFAGERPGLSITRGVSRRREADGFFAPGSGGGGNTATGSGALANNTTGSFNTATGVGALFSNTTGSNNTATGANTLQANTAGIFNTATGQGALFLNTTGDLNTGIGAGALQNNTTGSFNTAIGGTNPLFGNTTGNGNVAMGTDALQANSSGSSNTAIGTGALRGVTTGSSNIALGNNAGTDLTGGDHDNIHIGHFGVAGEVATMRLGSLQTQTFIAGVQGTTTGLPGAIPVLIDPTGQLGTASSSRRTKTDIQEIAETSEVLFKLRPISFRYAAHASRPGPREYGLIAEEVAAVLPDLVVYDRAGEPETVRYHLLPTLLLSELQKQRRTLTEQTKIIEGQQEAIAALKSRLEALERLLPSYAGR